jgi:Tol biopolymer transport system component
MALIVTRHAQRHLTVVSIDGTGARTVSTPLELQGAAGQPTVEWLDDEWLVAGATNREGPGLFRISIHGGAPERLVAAQATNPVRSPDGKLILFTGAFVGGQAGLQGIRPDGTPASLPSVNVRQGGYRFLPDGTGVVYLPGLQSRDFWLIDLATGSQRQLTSFGDRARLETFDITPDGKRILFDRQQENSDIVQIDLR